MLLGNLDLARDDRHAALTRFNECAVLAREADDPSLELWAFVGLGTVALREADAVRAGALFAQGARRSQRLGIAYFGVLSLIGLAEVCLLQGRAAQAARLSGAIAALRDALGIPLPPMFEALSQQTATAGRALVGDEAFTTAWGAGRALSLDEAIALALEETTPD
jgi:hypothetical protein